MEERVEFRKPVFGVGAPKTNETAAGAPKTNETCIRTGAHCTEWTGWDCTGYGATSGVAALRSMQEAWPVMGSVAKIASLPGNQ
jgi:hypothetical protein